MTYEVFTGSTTLCRLEAPSYAAALEIAQLRYGRTVSGIGVRERASNTTMPPALPVPSLWGQADACHAPIRLHGDGPLAWLLEDVVEIHHPPVVTGKQGLFTLSEFVERDVRRRLEGLRAEALTPFF